MKSILLATASILAFAGAAAADVTFGGDATIGYNINNGDEPRDADAADLGEGFFWEANLGVTLSQELNNGLTAAATFTLNAVDDDTVGGDAGAVTVDDNYLLSLTTETGGLFFGDTAFAAESKWDGVSEMAADDFSEQDDETVLRVDFSYLGVEASVSGIVADADDNRPVTSDLDQISVGLDTTISNFQLSLAYQQESEEFTNGPGVAYNPSSNDDFSNSEIFGISAGTTFGGADVQVAYAQDNTLNDDSLGFEVSYPFGPATIGAFYVIENDDASNTILGDGSIDDGEDLDNTFGLKADYTSGPVTVSAFYTFADDSPDAGDDDDYGIEVAYDTGAGIEVYAGVLDEDGNYIGVEYDLGNGAEIIASYSEKDEIGKREYQGGTTVALSLEF